ASSTARRSDYAAKTSSASRWSNGSRPSSSSRTLPTSVRVRAATTRTTSSTAIACRSEAARQSILRPALGDRAVEMFFALFRVRLGGGHGSVRKLRRPGSRVELQWLVAGVLDVVAGARRNDDRHVGFELRGVAVDDNLSLALLDAKELVGVAMDFAAE